MERDEVVDFINANLSAHLATVEDGAPRVRGMAVYRADEQGVLFHTGTFKSLYRQLKADPRVELCFNDPKTFTQIRVSGRAVETGDEALKREILEARPFLKGVASGADPLTFLAVFRVTDARFTVWTMAKNREATEYRPW